METRRRWIRKDNRYECTVSLEFKHLASDESLEDPVEGELKISLGTSIPHPVKLGIRDIEEDSGNAEYVDFEKREQIVTDPAEYPVVFPFTTHPSSEKGGKWYFYQTAEWVPDQVPEDKRDPEFVKHHVPIPSAQKIRIVHQIINGDADGGTIYDIMDLYGQERGAAADEFSRDIEGHVGFEARTAVRHCLVT